MTSPDSRHTLGIPHCQYKEVAVAVGYLGLFDHLEALQSIERHLSILLEAPQEVSSSLVGCCHCRSSRLRSTSFFDSPLLIQEVAVAVGYSGLFDHLEALQSIERHLSILLEAPQEVSSPLVEPLVVFIAGVHSV